MIKILHICPKVKYLKNFISLMEYGNSDSDVVHYLVFFDDKNVPKVLLDHYNDDIFIDPIHRIDKSNILFDITVKDAISSISPDILSYTALGRYKKLDMETYNIITGHDITIWSWHGIRFNNTIKPSDKQKYTICTNILEASDMIDRARFIDFGTVPLLDMITTIDYDKLKSAFYRQKRIDVGKKSILLITSQTCKEKKATHKSYEEGLDIFNMLCKSKNNLLDTFHLIVKQKGSADNAIDRKNNNKCISVINGYSGVPLHNLLFTDVHIVCGVTTAAFECIVSDGITILVDFANQGRFKDTILCDYAVIAHNIDDIERLIVDICASTHKYLEYKREYVDKYFPNLGQFSCKFDRFLHKCIG